MRIFNMAFLFSAVCCLSACADGRDQKQIDNGNNEAGAPPILHSQLTYPETETVDQVDVLHGVEVHDPYRWLEQDIRQSEQVAEWVAAQNKIATKYLSALPRRDIFRQEMENLYNHEKFGLPVKRGERVFYQYNDGLQNQFVLYVQDGSAEPRVLIDPNEWSDDDATALAGYWPSETGKYVAYAIQEGGSDWRNIRVMNVDSGEILNDEIKWVKFSEASWDPEENGFYYSRFPEPEDEDAYLGENYNQAVYFHALGSDAEQDTLIYSRPEQPEQSMYPYISENGRYLIIWVYIGTGQQNEIEIIDLKTENREPRRIVSGFKARYVYIGSIDDSFYFLSNDEAPNGEIVAISRTGERQRIVPQQSAALTIANIVGGKIIAHYVEDAKSAVRIFSVEGEALAQLEMPGHGAARYFYGRAKDDASYYQYSSFDTPRTIYKIDMNTLEQEIFKKPEISFDPDDYVIKQVFYNSKDGVRVPMFIVHRKDLDLSQGAPTMLTGYGGFNASILPYFLFRNAVWLNHGGVFALANLRGGGEYGKEWYDAGKGLKKQNVFDDFIAAAEYLNTEGYSSNDKLAIYGGSNGGLLVGAVLNQRPELFAAAVPAVGVMDMVRFSKFTAGRYWTGDYGDPEKEEDFKNLYAYSPYHNIRSDVAYPPVLATTADTDDRVVPGHSFKYIARLQASDSQGGPHLIRIETRAGHGRGKPVDKALDEAADVLAFMAYHSGMTRPPN